MKNYLRHIFTTALFILTFAVLAISASAASETETNDNVSIANSISVNETVYANCMLHDKDFFTFTIPSDGYISVVVNHEYIDSTGEFGTIKIFDNSLTYIEKRVNKNSVTTTTADLGLTAGTYYVSFSGNSSKNGYDYNIKVNYTSSSVWETETNDSLDRANSISVNTTYYASLVKSEHDIYTFSTDRTGTVSVTLNHEYIDSTGEFCTVVFYTYDGTSETEIYSLRIDKNKETTTSIKLGLPAGKYYFEVKGTTNKEYAYKFELDFTATDSWEVLPNNAIPQSTPISIGSTYYGVFYGSSDKDFYSFTLDKNSTVKITFNHGYEDSTSTFATCRIISYDGSSETQLAEFKAKKNSDSTVSNPINLPAGKYYLKVICDAAKNCEYNFKISYSSNSTANSGSSSSSGTRPTQAPTRPYIPTTQANGNNNSNKNNNGHSSPDFVEATTRYNLFTGDNEIERPTSNIDIFHDDYAQVEQDVYENNYEVENRTEREDTDKDEDEDRRENKDRSEIPTGLIIIIVALSVGLVAVGGAIIYYTNKTSIK